MFENTDSKVESARQSLEIRKTVILAYESARQVKYLLELYNVDPTYTAGVNAIYPTTAEKVELNTVANLFRDLVVNLETNHADIIRTIPT